MRDVVNGGDFTQSSIRRAFVIDTGGRRSERRWLPQIV
eukprot:COSAG02_NODE_37644_length_439_cov_0.897059_1_plen_37_part_10